MEQLGISKLDLKRQNRMQVLKIIKQKGPTSRIDIANTLELTRAAVTIITNEMIEQGVITEIGESKQVPDIVQRGRKKILLDINHNFKFALGITVEENLVSIGLSTLAGEVLDKCQVEINKSTQFEELLGYIRRSFLRILSDNCLGADSVIGIGLGVAPSMYYRMQIDVVNKTADFRKLVSIFKSFTTLPVVVDNYVKGAAMANIDFQKNKDPNRHNIAFLTYGESLHFVVTNLNDPIISYDNRTDFVDNMIINPGSVMGIGSGNGNVQTELTSSAFRNKIIPYYTREDVPYLYDKTNGDISKVTRRLIYESINNGDEKIRWMYTEIMLFTAVLLNNLIFSTNPQKLVLHDFNFSESEFTYLKSIVEKVAGEEIAKLIDLSIIEDKNRFLAGSAIAIRELFFSRGGFSC